MKNIYEKGTIKVVYLGKDPDRIFSKMFDDEKKALEFAKDKDDYLIFSLISQKKMRDFSWKLLPFGQYSTYKKLFGIYKKNKTGVLKFLKLL